MEYLVSIDEIKAGIEESKRFKDMDLAVVHDAIDQMHQSGQHHLANTLDALTSIAFHAGLAMFGLTERYNAAVSGRDKDAISQVITVIRREAAASGARAKLAKDSAGKHAVMISIQNEWTRRKDAGQKFKAVEFAREMAKEHKDVVTVEAIKNAQTRWNKQYHPAS